MGVLIHNKKAGFNYEFLEKLSAGMELLGFEVKSLTNKQGSLEGAYVLVRGGEAFLINAHIPPYQANNTPDSYDPYRNRKLLLTKKELEELTKVDKQNGLTVVPISVYNKGQKLKLEIAIGRGKRKTDKRENIKKREANIDINRTLKGEY